MIICTGNKILAERNEQERIAGRGLQKPARQLGWTVKAPTQKPLQFKNDSDAETCAETICRNHAVVRADGCAVVRTETDADLRAEHRVVIRAENGTGAAHWQSQNHYKS
jgi:hypothetical protein